MIFKAIFWGAFAAMTLAGCQAYRFQIQQTNADRFADPKLPAEYSTQNNRLARRSQKNSLGDSGRFGIFVNPYARREPNGTQVFGFEVLHRGSAARSEYHPLRQLVFLTDSGERVAVTLENPLFRQEAQIIHSERGGGNHYPEFYETARGTLSPEDFRRLAKARWLEVKIIGESREQIFDQKAVLPEFLENLRGFYNLASR